MPRPWKPCSHVKAFLRVKLGAGAANASSEGRTLTGSNRRTSALRRNNDEANEDQWHATSAISVHRQKIMQYLWKSNNDLEMSFQESANVHSWLHEHMLSTKPHLNPSEQDAFMNRMLKRMIDKAEPLAYILESTPFGPLSIICRQPVLIPRPETEQLTEHVAQIIIDAVAARGTEQRQRQEALEEDPLPVSSSASSSTLSSLSCSRERPLRILDLCTGSGCIALLLSHRLRAKSISATVVAVDKNEEALKLARLNKKKQEHPGKKRALSTDAEKDTGADGKGEYDRGRGTSCVGIGPKTVQVSIKHVDLFDEQQVSRLIEKEGPFDLVISNPPYITRAEYNDLDDSVRNWESLDALCGDLVGDEGGLAFYKRIAQLAQSHSDPSSSHYLFPPASEVGPTARDMPSLVVEVGHTQAERVKSIFAATGIFSDVSIWKDAWDVQRGVIAWIQSERLGQRSE